LTERKSLLFTSIIVRGGFYAKRQGCRDKAKPCPISFKWQRSFHDHIIRNEKSLQKISEYIINNPVTWEKDENNISSLEVRAD